MTPTARSMQWLRKHGFIVAKVEQRLPIPDRFVTRDCFGFGDLLAVHPDYGIVLVQVTSASNVNAREKKARALPDLQVWLKSGGRFSVQGWKKAGKRGERKTWRIVEKEIEPNEMPQLLLPS